MPSKAEKLGRKNDPLLSAEVSLLSAEVSGGGGARVLAVVGAGVGEALGGAVAAEVGGAERASQEPEQSLSQLFWLSRQYSLVSPHSTNGAQEQQNDPEPSAGAGVADGEGGESEGVCVG